ncbi:unnamed protein product [Haemonchus placei]|uniref:MFS domain-containing protein n=1 Tax=Haemonchus placei TaxID=6290 RepID=A0A0N4WDY0_HAEPC|nr:unnamed protein product [Haemonchus placei]
MRRRRHGGSLGPNPPMLQRGCTWSIQTLCLVEQAFVLRTDQTEWPNGFGVGLFGGQSYDEMRINLIFGAITCIGGIAGVGVGSTLAGFLRTGFGPFRFIQTVRSDAIVCGLGALIGVPTLFFAIHEIPYNMALCWVLMFVCITATCFNWATNVDMLMAVVIPTRRNAANSWQILISHLCGDASGPYIIGLVC